MKLQIVEDDLFSEAIAALLRLHLDDMHRWSPPCSVHAMPIERLKAADVTFYSAWDGEVLAGCGALKELDAGHGEIKSMRASPDYRGKGVGKAVLLHLIDEARRRGYSRSVDSYIVGMAAMAMPVRSGGQVISCLSIAAPAVRMTLERMAELAPHLSAAAEEIGLAANGSKYFPGLHKHG